MSDILTIVDTIAERLTCCSGGTLNESSPGVGRYIVDEYRYDSFF